MPIGVKSDNTEEVMCSYMFQKFQESMVSKSEETKLWKEALEAYNGTLYKKNQKPDYKSDVIINYVFKTIETIRPIMTDNNPRFQALARNKDGVEKADIINKAMDYEWDREKMTRKLPKACLSSLVTGNAIFYLPWNGKKQQVECILVDPYNIYVDPLATSFMDAEYVIYATYKHVNILKKMYPNKANDLMGSGIKYSELVADNDKTASNITNQVLVLEMWCRDYTTIDQEEVDENGIPIIKKKFKYPKGRWIISCPELNIVLQDKANPYQDGKFPFVQMKDYDIPYKFWGKSDVEQILSPQHYMNELNNQIVDNAKHTANMQWIVDKNSGIPKGTLTNRPGLIVRKNPGSDVRRETPPTMPAYVENKVIELKQDIETITGIHEANAGDRPTGIQAGIAITALQEAGQTRIRLKVKLMESALSELATMWYSRMQQFWKEDRFVRIAKEEGGVEFDKIGKDELSYDYDIRITSGSTMPNNKSSKLDLMIRLAQTPAEDGLPMVDRRSVLEYVDLKDKKGLIDRMESLAGEGNVQQQLESFMQQQEQVHNELNQVISDMAKQISNISKQLGGIEGQWKNLIDENEKLKIARDNRERGYQIGLKEMPPDLQADEQAALDTIRQNRGSIELSEQIRQGIIPPDVLNELQQLPDDQLQQILQQYPQLEEMIQNQ